MENSSNISKKLIMELIYCAAVALFIIDLFIPFAYLDELGNLNMLDIYGFGNNIAALSSEIGLDGGMAVMRFTSIYYIWLPIIMLVVSAVMIFLKRRIELGFGMGIAVIPPVLLLNIGHIYAIDSIISMCQEEHLMDSNESFSYMPFMLNIVAALAVLAVIITMFVQDKGIKLNPGTVHRYGVVRIKNGTLSGSPVNSPTTAELRDMTPVKIGRGPGADIMIVNAAKSVSKQHCELMYYSNEDKYYVTDISSYGTSIGNGTKLVKNMKTPVSKGTVLILAGKEQIVLE